MKRFFLLGILMFTTFTLVATMAAAGKDSAFSEEKPIVFASVNGTQYKIVVSSRTSLPEYTGALELQKAIRDMEKDISRKSGEIISVDQVPAAPVKSIVIGTLDSPLIQPLADQLKLRKSEDDEIAIYCIDGNIYLAGNSPRAALYAVYAFMRKYMGVKWLWPGEGGTFYTSDIGSVPNDLAFNYKPSFRFRMMSLQEKNSDESRFFNVRNFVHDEDFRFGGDRYTGGEAISPRRSDFKDHPEEKNASAGMSRRTPRNTVSSWNSFFHRCLISSEEKVWKENVCSMFPMNHPMLSWRAMLMPQIC